MSNLFELPGIQPTQPNPKPGHLKEDVDYWKCWFQGLEVRMCSLA